MLETPANTLRTARGNMPLRCKTGTSNGFRDAWTVGLVGPYVLVIWAGNFDNSPNPLLVGGEVAAPLFGEIARAMALREPLPDLLAAQEASLNLVRIPTCLETGDTDVSLCRQTVPTLFIPGRSPSRPSGIYRTILVDAATGLRACEPSATTREEVWAFWPSDLRGLFARAGIVKPVPPEFLPQCLAGESGGETLAGMAAGAGGAAPRILTPKAGVRYQRRLGDEARNAMPLAASADADVTSLFWFANERFLGTSAPDEPLLWHAESGRHTLRVLDNKGRVTVQRVVVELAP